MNEITKEIINLLGKHNLPLVSCLGYLEVAKVELIKKAEAQIAEA